MKSAVMLLCRTHERGSTRTSAPHFGIGKSPHTKDDDRSLSCVIRMTLFTLVAPQVVVIIRKKEKQIPCLPGLLKDRHPARCCPPVINRKAIRLLAGLWTPLLAEVCLDASWSSPLFGLSLQQRHVLDSRTWVIGQFIFLNLQDSVG